VAFIPLSDVKDRPMAFPFVNIALIVVNVMVYFLLQPTLAASPSGALPGAVAAFYDRFAVVPVRLAAGQNLSSIFTAMFLHGGVIHLGGNMLYLWIFGDNVEHALGHGRYLLFYLASGVAATLLQVALFPTSAVWNLGASGAIAGVLGAYLVLYPSARVNVMIGRGWITRMRAVVVIGLWFILQLLSGGGQLLAAGSAGGVAYWAHVGGFLAGAGAAKGLAVVGIADPWRPA